MRDPKVKALAYGAVSIALAFVLSYVKLFSMPMGGSITLLSMLPICLYASAFGPAYGFSAAFAYSLLQFVQEPYFLNVWQLLLDYLLAFTCLGLASLFPGKLALGIGVSGFARLMCSVFSGVLFYAAYAAEAGYQSAWLYSFAYNGSSLGVDALICVIVALLPPVASLTRHIKGTEKA